MRLISSLLALPLLASAIPTSRSEGFKVQDADQLGDFPTEKLGWTMDLDELRLVQFSEDEPPL